MIDSRQAKWVDYYLNAANGQDSANAVQRLLSLIDVSILIDQSGNRELISTDVEDQELIAAQIASALLAAKEERGATE